VLCPSCGNDTNPTLRFCEFCGSVMDIDFERAGSALAYEDEGAVSERMERRTLGFLYLSIYILVVVVIVRVLLNKPVQVEYSPSFSVPGKLSEGVTAKETLKVDWKTFELPK